jgi:N-hydroxyarylamine O-acetyltransferase
VDESQRPLDLDAYFERIGFAATPQPTLEALRSLHRLHAEAIPFENLSPFLGEPVRLDPASLQDKLIQRRRGGWCYEQNLLFAHVLEAIGFPVKRLAARVRWNVPPGVVTARSHMLMQVMVDGDPYIADVGFGGQTLTAPLRLEPLVEQATPHEPYRLLPEGGGFVLESRIAGSWSALYAFEPHEQQLPDYEVSNWYLANHPQSQFVTGIIAARAAPDRRHALRNARYAIHHRGGHTERRVIASVEEFRAILSNDLGIPLPASPRLDAGLERLVREGRSTPSSVG